MSKTKAAKIVLMLSLTCLLSTSCGTNPTGTATALLNQVWTVTSPFPGHLRWEGPGGPTSDTTVIGTTFQPTAAGKTVNITFSGSSTALRIPAEVAEGTAILDDQRTPTTSVTTLSFVTQNTNVHTLIALNITGAALDDTITIEVVQQP